MKYISLLTMLFGILLIAGCQSQKTISHLNTNNNPVIQQIKKEFHYHKEVTIWDQDKKNHVIVLFSSNDKDQLKKEVTKRYYLAINSDNSDNYNQQALTGELEIGNEPETRKANISEYILEYHLQEGITDISIKTMKDL